MRERLIQDTELQELFPAGHTLALFPTGYHVGTF